MHVTENLGRWSEIFITENAVTPSFVFNHQCVGNSSLDFSETPKGTVNNYFSLNFLCVFLRWFHGKLDRADAEKRLTNIGQVGSYLVRESDRRPGTYSLSYLGRNGISHFRVTGVCGDYYIGGRQFCSLNDLIGYYTAWSCLLKDEHLKFPVPPPEPVLVKKRVIAKYTYSKVPDTDELR